VFEMCQEQQAVLTDEAVLYWNVQDEDVDDDDVDGQMYVTGPLIRRVFIDRYMS
jgi:hypothetical protein